MLTGDRTNFASPALLAGTATVKSTRPCGNYFHFPTKREAHAAIKRHSAAFRPRLCVVSATCPTCGKIFVMRMV